MTLDPKKTSVVFLIALGLSAPIQAEENPLQASLRSGVEFDDNVNRESANPQSGFLSRYFVAFNTSTQPFEHARIRFNAKHGGKFFFENELANADTLVTQFSLAFEHQFLPELMLDTHVDMKDRTERLPIRDYNRGGLGLGLSLSLADVRLRLGGAYRYFAFKPNPSSGSSNLESKANANWAISHAFSMSLGYTFARRLFETDRFIQDGSELRVDEGRVRTDDFHSVYLQARYTGPFIASATYSLSLNISNSFGQELLRQTLTTSATFPLWFDFFATIKLELQRTSYEDPVLIDADFLVDEDNRNAVITSLARGFGEHWEAELRYSLFLQEFGVGADYQRQTLFLAMAFLFD